MLWRIRSLLVGLIIGLLVSPGSGAENRKHLWLWLRNQIEQTRPAVESRLHEVTAQGKAVAEQSIEQARQQVAPVVQQAQAKVTEIGQAIPAPIKDTAGNVINAVGRLADQAAVALQPDTASSTEPAEEGKA